MSFLERGVRSMSTRNDQEIYLTDSEREELRDAANDPWGRGYPGDEDKPLISRHWEYFWYGFVVGSLIQIAILGPWFR